MQHMVKVEGSTASPSFAKPGVTMHLSTVGYVHTFFGLVGVVLALYMLIKHRKMDPTSSAGIAYFVTITVSCLLVFVLPHDSPSFNPVPGYILTLLTLTALFVGFFIRFFKISAGKYLEPLGLCGSLFFSMVPAINETLTRLPVDAPLASSPQDPLVLKSIGGLAIAIFALCIAQVVSVRKAERESRVTQGRVT
jgi:asparagine N-glycosylation enzyme membrane subunit Stt3